MLVVILKYGIIEILIVVIVVVIIVTVVVVTEGVAEMIRGEKFDQKVNQPPTTIILPNNTTNQHTIPHNRGTTITLSTIEEDPLMIEDQVPQEEEHHQG